MATAGYLEKNTARRTARHQVRQCSRSTRRKSTPPCLMYCRTMFQSSPKPQPVKAQSCIFVHRDGEDRAQSWGRAQSHGHGRRPLGILVQEVREDSDRRHARPGPRALKTDLVDVKVCAVSEIWSGLKFVVRKKLRQPIAALC